LDEFGELICLCFGAWVEASEDIHWLIQVLANLRLKYQRLQSGQSGGNTKLELAILPMKLIAVKGMVGKG
jgi:hypothetical protein